MANLHKFVVTDKVAGYIEVAGDLYVTGDIIYLPEHQVNHYQKSSYIINGLLEYAGEVEPADTSMTEEFMTLYDAKFAPNKNILPIFAIKLATGLAKAVDPFGVPAADSAGSFTPSRRLYVSKIGIKYLAGNSVAGAGVRPPWYLVTAGSCLPITPSVLTAYDYTAGTYTAATNGSIAAAAPIPWAANDMLIVGYTDKFSSVVWSIGTVSNQSTSVTAFYWTASGWKEFLDENGIATLVDFTEETAGRTLTSATANDKTRMVWWTQPTDWIAGGPNGAGISTSDYCVALKFSGALTNLADTSVYTVLDRPLTYFKLGSYYQGTEHFYTYKAATWSYGFDIDGWGAAGDAVYIATDNKWTSLYVDMSANVNVVSTTVVFEYWNGAEWIAMTVTDGTDTGGNTPFAQDGWLTITSPIPVDWEPALGSDINSNITATGNYFWFRIRRTAGGTTSAGTAINLVENQVLSPNVWQYYNIIDEGLVEAGEPIHMICMLEDADMDGVEVMAIAADI